VICRWRHPSGLILDAMPSEPGILGFANRWQAAANSTRPSPRTAIGRKHPRRLPALPPRHQA
jgi:hypothetical protein